MDTLPTWAFIASIPGCAALTVITVNVIRASSGFDAKWLPLAVAFLWQLAAWAVLSDKSGASWGLMLAATVMTWTAATGGNEVVNGVILNRADRKRAMSWSEWWRPWY